MIVGCIKNLQIEAKIKYDTTEIPNGSCTVLAGSNYGTIQNIDVIVDYQGVERFGKGRLLGRGKLPCRSQLWTN